jgi:hypothetical protein
MKLVADSSGLCGFCGKPITLRDGWLELFSQAGGRLQYPTFGAPVACFSHQKCGPDTGYPIELQKLVNVEKREHPQCGFVRHIEDKGWCSSVYLDAIRTGEALRLQLQASSTSRVNKTTRTTRSQFLHPWNTLSHWLAAQQHRDDPVGDLVRDLAADTAVRAPDLKSYGALLQYLRGKHAAAAAIQAAKQAWDEHRRSRPR